MFSQGLICFFILFGNVFFSDINYSVQGAPRRDFALQQFFLVLREDKFGQIFFCFLYKYLKNVLKPFFRSSQNVWKKKKFCQIFLDFLVFVIVDLATKRFTLNTEIVLNSYMLFIAGTLLPNHQLWTTVKGTDLLIRCQSFALSPGLPLQLWVTKSN